MPQENKGDRATFQGIRECWFWERLSFSVRCSYSLSCLTCAESAIHGLSLNKYQIPPFLLTNTLHSEIPHPGYRGRHGHVFFNFVEVDNKLLHLVTTVFCGVPFFFWISVLCRIVCSRGCECMLLDLCPVLHFAFKQMWAHFATPSFRKLLTFFQARISKDIVFNSFETPLGSPHSSLGALLMLPWFLELALLCFLNWQNLLGMPGKSASSQVRAWDLFCGESLHLLLSKLQGLAQTSMIFSYLFSILLVLWWIRDGGPHL